MEPQIEIRFYTKDGCHLCEDAWQMLMAVADEYSVTVEAVDITGDPELYDRFKHAIPVIEVDGEAVLGGRFCLADLRETLASRQRR